MADQPAPRGGGWSSASDDEGWGPATPVRSGSWHGGQTPPRNVVKPPNPKAPKDKPAPAGWNAGGPLPRRRGSDGRSAAASYPWTPATPAAPAPRKERGLPWWGALLVLIAIAAVGGLIDMIGSSQSRSGFNIGIVVASVVAIIVVRRRHMFPVVIAPPIIYTAAAVFDLYLRSGGLSNRKVVFDAAANYLVYGFPAIASASAAVLIIAGVRMITRR